MSSAQVIADGLVIESFGLVIDEASLTGESDPMHKGPKDPWCRSGTQVIPICFWRCSTVHAGLLHRATCQMERAHQQHSYPADTKPALCRA